MSPGELKTRLEEVFTDAQVAVKDLTGTADHYQVTIATEAFRDKLPMARHRMVYAAVGEQVGKEIHALSVTALLPEQWASD